MTTTLQRPAPTPDAASGTTGEETSRRRELRKLVVLAVGALLVASMLPVALRLGGLSDGSSAAPFSMVPRAVLVAAVAAPVAVWAAISLRDTAVRTFGGVGGDVIGAGVEVALTVLLVLLTVAW